MVFFIIYVFCTLCLLSVFLSYHAQDTSGIIPHRIWAFFIFLCFVPILNTIVLLVLMFNHDNPQVEDPVEALKGLEELGKKLEELFNKFNKR